MPPSKLEELKKEIHQWTGTVPGGVILSYALIDDLLDRAFHLGRIEQHERDLNVIRSAKEERKRPETSFDYTDPQVRIYQANAWGEQVFANIVLDSLLSVSPVEGEE